MKDLTYLRLTDEDLGKIMRRTREDAIEECAVAMESYDGFSPDERRIAAAAIRAALRMEPGR